MNFKNANEFLKITFAILKNVMLNVNFCLLHTSCHSLVNEPEA